MEITPEDILEVVKKPLYRNVGCSQHHFFVGMVEGMMLIVYGELTSEGKVDIKCADWLLNFNNRTLN